MSADAQEQLVLMFETSCATSVVFGSSTRSHSKLNLVRIVPCSVLAAMTSVSGLISRKRVKRVKRVSTILTPQPTHILLENAVVAYATFYAMYR